MQFTYVVQVEVSREEGKFAGRDELSEQIRENIEGADPGQLDGDEGGVYAIDGFEVEEEAMERGRELMQVTAAERRMIEEARATRRRGRR